MLLPYFFIEFVKTIFFENLLFEDYLEEVNNTKSYVLLLFRPYDSTQKFKKTETLKVFI